VIENGVQVLALVKGLYIVLRSVRTLYKFREQSIRPMKVVKETSNELWTLLASIDESCTLTLVRGAARYGRVSRCNGSM
jgi:hypothetical protein